MIRRSAFASTPPVVKNLIIINALFFLAKSVLPQDFAYGMIDSLGLHFFQNESFRLHQLISYLFLHANLSHFLMNMFALWMFGSSLEYDLGSKRFLTYYLITGIGAGLIQQGVNFAEWTHLMLEFREAYSSQTQIALNAIHNGLTIGASGSVFGVLLAFGILHPNRIIMLLIPPIPIKAKYFVIIYGLIELSLGVVGTGGSIAHFAHVGGMLFGYILLKIWKLKDLDNDNRWQ